VDPNSACPGVTGGSRKPTYSLPSAPPFEINGSIKALNIAKEIHISIRIHVIAITCITNSRVTTALLIKNFHLHMYVVLDDEI
jgi:hypothetical protein